MKRIPASRRRLIAGWLLPVLLMAAVPAPAAGLEIAGKATVIDGMIRRLRQRIEQVKSSAFSPHRQRPLVDDMAHASTGVGGGRSQWFPPLR